MSVSEMTCRRCGYAIFETQRVSWDGQIPFHVSLEDCEESKKLCRTKAHP